jgi:hypothetical protein
MFAWAAILNDGPREASGDTPSCFPALGTVQSFAIY